MFFKFQLKLNAKAILDTPDIELHRKYIVCNLRLVFVSLEAAIHGHIFADGHSVPQITTFRKGEVHNCKWMFPNQ